MTLPDVVQQHSAQESMFNDIIKLPCVDQVILTIINSGYKGNLSTIEKILKMFETDKTY